MDSKDILKYLAGIIKEIGLTGFIVIVVVFVFFVWGTVSQKREFIDTYILFKNNNAYPCVIIILFLSLIVLIGGIYYEKMLKLRKEENNRIGQEKSEWQELALNKKLKSSK